MQHEIPLLTAIEMAERYRTKRSDNLPLSETFELSAVLRLLAVKGAAFLRIYYGLKEDGQIHSMLVVADASEKDILPDITIKVLQDADGPIILEDGYRCPPACPPPSPLNP